MFRGLRFFFYHGWKYDKKYILYRLMNQLVSALIPIVATIMPKYIIDELMGAKRPDVLMLYVGIMAGFALIANALSHFFSMAGFTRRCYVGAAFDLELHRTLAYADYHNLESPEFLDMQKKAEKFLYCDWHGFGYLLDCALNIVGQCITLVGIGAIISTLNVYMILLFVALVIAGAVVESWAKRRAMETSMEIVSNQRGWTYYASLFSDFRYGKEIRINRLADWLLKREKYYIEKANDNLRRQNNYYMKSGALSAVFTFLQQCAAYAYLLRRAILNSLAIGDFMMYAGAVTSFATAMRRVMDSLVEIKAYDMYYDALNEYLQIPSKFREGKRLGVTKQAHRIEFRNVSFRYPEQDVYALRHINLTLNAGEKLSIVGENGAGKTTFVKLLLRLYDPVEGAILLDGVDVRDIDYEQYMDQFATVFQDFKLFSFSLKENIAFDSAASDEKIEEVLRLAGFDSRITSLPHGIHTHVNREFDEQGFEPSGGEAQKIALARALYKDAPIVILDEPTAALDPRAEYEMYQHFDALVAGKTAIFISHRLSSAQFCDKIAVFARGEIVEYGDHETLQNMQGLYAELYAMQAKFYSETY